MDKVTGTGADGILRTLEIFTSCQMLFRWSYEEDQGVLVRGVFGVGALQVLVGILEGNSHLKVIGIDVRIILMDRQEMAGVELGWSLFGWRHFSGSCKKNVVSHWIAWNVWNCLTSWGTVLCCFNQLSNTTVWW